MQKKKDQQTLSEKDVLDVRKRLEAFPELPDLAVFMNMTGNPTRLRIVFLLGALKEVCVSDLARILGVSVSAVSQHLAKFKAYGLVRQRRVSQTIYYSLSENQFVSKLEKHFLSQPTKR